MGAELRGAVRETLRVAIETETQISPRAVAQRVISDYPDVIHALVDDLTLRAILAEIKRQLREHADGAGELSLLGFPRVIAIPSGHGEYVWVPSLRAAWVDIEGGLQTRVDNLSRAQARLDQYMEAMETVRELMEGTSRTLARAIQMLGQRRSRQP